MLEAEVQQNRESSEAWRLLGQLYQENDQDDFAIIAFKQAHESDPYDLDSLMSLGISSTNELEQMQALRCLKEWLQYHPDYSNIDVLQGAGEHLHLDQVEDAFN